MRPAAPDEIVSPEGERTPLTDAELVERAIAGAEDGFRGLVSRHQRSVYNLLVRLLRNPARAEELAQETFLRAFSHLHTFDPRFKFSSWLLRIAHNLAVDALRRKAPDETPFDDSTPAARARLEQALADPRSDAAVLQVEQSDLAKVLDAALARLRPEYRQLVVLRHHEDLSYEEIAGITGFPVGTVKSYLHRARAEMAEYLRKNGWGGAEG